ncbi:MAG: amino acid ABC transporter substrate-binding protein [Gammaproteobacteria bacterium]|nr:amino acid ABC transporter substrate-binding protein [Gammaproteobacteria bacterium]
MLKFILSILLLSLTVLPCSNAIAQKNLVLNISIPAPFHTDDGKEFVDIILKEVFQRIDMKVKIAQLFDLLTHGRVQVVIYDAWLGLAHLRENNIRGVKMLEPASAERDLYVYLHKKHTNLVPRVENAYRAVKADGTYEHYFQQIFDPLVRQ